MTSLVQHAGGGTYTVANVQAGTGADRHAGWSLVVAYQDVTQPPRNLTIFDGFGQVALNANVPMTVTGFKTPLTGPVNTQIGIVAYEGDRDLTGDGVRLNGTPLGDASHPSGNFFDSSISKLGTPVTGSAPDYTNQLGFDAGVLAAPAGAVGTNQTTATIDLSTVNDRYLPGVVYFRTDIYAPQMVLHKTVTDVNGGAVNPGDVLQYDISSTNTGLSPAFDSRINDAIPPHTAYKPDSLKILTSPGGIAGDKTDLVDADQAEYDKGPNEVRFRIGTGATSLGGGGAPVRRRRRHHRPGRVVQRPLRRRRRRRHARRHPDPQHGRALEQGRRRQRLHLDSQCARGRDRARRAGRDDRQVAHRHASSAVSRARSTWSSATSAAVATSGEVVIDDTLPNGLGIVSAGGVNWTCSVTPRRTRCTAPAPTRSRRAPPSSR